MINQNSHIENFSPMKITELFKIDLITEQFFMKICKSLGERDIKEDWIANFLLGLESAAGFQELA